MSKKILNTVRNSFALFFILCSAQILGQHETDIFPAWEEGQLEIHHINTASGECVFCIFPDGTNMLIDAGDLGPDRDPVHTNTMPSTAKQPGEWIGRYISRLIENRPEKKIDYALLTHFHGDHMGKPSSGSPQTKKGGDYLLSGLTEVAEYVPFKMMIDRAWPFYEYPSPLAGGKTFDNYKKFLDWNIRHTNMKVERFQPGSNSQFSLLYSPEQYPEFEVRNIYANGEIWTGEKEKTKYLFPVDAMLDENRICTAIKISYGDFDYFNGGDIIGRISLNTPVWKDVETPVGNVLGPVEVCEVNHHSYVDAMNESFIASTQPQVFVIQAWNARHINLTTLRAMTSTELYPGERHVFSTNIHEFALNYLGKNIDKISAYGGHVVIKVLAGGDEYKVYLLSAKDELKSIKSVFGPFRSK